MLTAGSGLPEREQALELLCSRYWHPLYAFIRRRGFTVEQAEDLTQEFFARLLAAKSLEDVSPERGKFRAFLLAALKNFLANEWDRSRRLKRGGGEPVLSLDLVEGEAWLASDHSPAGTEDAFFDRHWAKAFTAAVMHSLKRQAREDGALDRFEALKVFLASEPSANTYEDVAARLGMNVPAVKSAIHRLRRQYGQMVRDEMAATLVNEADVEAEIRYLFKAVST